MRFAHRIYINTPNAATEPLSITHEALLQNLIEGALGLGALIIPLACSPISLSSDTKFPLPQQQPED